MWLHHPSEQSFRGSSTPSQSKVSLWSGPDAPVVRSVGRSCGAQGFGGSWIPRSCRGLGSLARTSQEGGAKEQHEGRMKRSAVGGRSCWAAACETPVLSFQIPFAGDDSPRGNRWATHGSSWRISPGADTCACFAEGLFKLKIPHRWPGQSDAR